MAYPLSPQVRDALIAAAGPRGGSRTQYAIGGSTNAGSILRGQTQQISRYASPAERNRAFSVAGAKGNTGGGGGGGISGIFKDALGSFLEAINVPRKVVTAGAEVLQEQITGRDINKNFWQNITEDKNYGYGRLIEADFPGAPGWLKTALGFAGDVALDPLTYVTFGAGPALEIAGKSKGLARIALDTGERAYNTGMTEAVAKGITGEAEKEAYANAYKVGGRNVTGWRDIGARVAQSTAKATPEELKDLAIHSGEVPASQANTFTHGLGFKVPLSHKAYMIPGTEGFGRLGTEAGNAFTSWLGKTAAPGRALGGEAWKAKQLLKSGDPAAVNNGLRLLDAMSRGKGVRNSLERELSLEWRDIEKAQKQVGLDGKTMYTAAGERPHLTSVGAEEGTKRLTEAGPTYAKLTPQQRVVVDRWGKMLDSLPDRTGERAAFRGVGKKWMAHATEDTGRPYVPRIPTGDLDEVFKEASGTRVPRMVGAQRPGFTRKGLNVGDNVFKKDATTELFEPGSQLADGTIAPSLETQIQSHVDRVIGEGAKPWYVTDANEVMRSYIKDVSRATGQIHQANYLVAKRVAAPYVSYGLEALRNGEIGVSIQDLTEHFAKKVDDLGEQLGRHTEDLRRVDAEQVKLSERWRQGLIDQGEHAAEGARLEAAKDRIVQEMRATEDKLKGAASRAKAAGVARDIRAQKMSLLRDKVDAARAERDRIAQELADLVKAKKGAPESAGAARQAGQPGFEDVGRLEEDLVAANQVFHRAATDGARVNDVFRQAANAAAVSDHIQGLAAQMEATGVNSITPNDPFYGPMAALSGEMFGGRLPEQLTATELTTLGHRVTGHSQEALDELRTLATIYPEKIDPATLVNGIRDWTQASVQASEAMTAATTAEEFTGAAERYRTAQEALGWHRTAQTLQKELGHVPTVKAVQERMAQAGQQMVDIGAQLRGVDPQVRGAALIDRETRRMEETLNKVGFTMGDPGAPQAAADIMGQEVAPGIFQGADGKLRTVRPTQDVHYAAMADALQRMLGFGQPKSTIFMDPHGQWFHAQEFGEGVGTVSELLTTGDQDVLDKIADAYSNQALTDLLLGTHTQGLDSLAVAADGTLYRLDPAVPTVQGPNLNSPGAQQAIFGDLTPAEVNQLGTKMRVLYEREQKQRLRDFLEKPIHDDFDRLFYGGSSTGYVRGETGLPIWDELLKNSNIHPSDMTSRVGMQWRELTGNLALHGVNENGVVDLRVLARRVLGNSEEALAVGQHLDNRFHALQRLMDDQFDADTAGWVAQVQADGPDNLIHAALDPDTHVWRPVGKKVAALRNPEEGGNTWFHGWLGEPGDATAGFPDLSQPFPVETKAETMFEAWADYGWGPNLAAERYLPDIFGGGGFHGGEPGGVIEGTLATTPDRVLAYGPGAHGDFETLAAQGDAVSQQAMRDRQLTGHYPPDQDPLHGTAAQATGPVDPFPDMNPGHSHYMGLNQIHDAGPGYEMFNADVLRRVAKDRPDLIDRLMGHMANDTVQVKYNQAAEVMGLAKDISRTARGQGYTIGFDDAVELAGQHMVRDGLLPEEYPWDNLLSRVNSIPVDGYKPYAAQVGRIIWGDGLPGDAIKAETKLDLLETARQSLARDGDVVMYWNMADSRSSDVGFLHALPTNQVTYRTGQNAAQIAAKRKAYEVPVRTLGDIKDAIFHKTGDLVMANDALKAVETQYKMAANDYTDAIFASIQADAEQAAYQAQRDMVRSNLAGHKADLQKQAAAAYQRRDALIQANAQIAAQIEHLDGKASELQASIAHAVIEHDVALGQQLDLAEYLSGQLRQGWKGMGFGFQAPEDVVDVITHIASQRAPNTTEGMGKFLRVFDQITNWMKGWMTSSSGFQIRNQVGGMFNNWLAGADVFRTTKDMYSLLLKGWQKKELTFVEQAQHTIIDRMGLLHSGLFTDEFSSGLKGGGSINPFAGLRNPEKAFWMPWVTRKLGESVTEPALRGSLILDRLNKAVEGGRIVLDDGTRITSWKQIDTAIKSEQFSKAVLESGLTDQMFSDVAKYHFDYDDLSHFERSVMRRVIPFYTWTRKNVPLQLEAALTKPGKALLRYQALARNVSMGVPEEQIVPSYFGEQQMFATPFTSNGNRIYGTIDLPFKDLYRITDPGQMLANINPLIKAPIEWWAHKQFFSDLPLTPKLNKMPDTFAAIPGFPQVLKALGQADQDKKGNWLIRENALYAIGQYFPALQQVRRLVPTELKFQQRAMSTYVSYLGGIQLRTNTPGDQESEIYRRVSELDGVVNDLKARGIIPTKPKKDVNARAPANEARNARVLALMGSSQSGAGLSTPA